MKHEFSKVAQSALQRLGWPPSSLYAMVRQQESKGRAKYGADLDAYTGSDAELEHHLAQELIDALLYVELLIMRDPTESREDIASLLGTAIKLL